MKLGFLRPKFSKEQAEQQAMEELEAAVARAKPPTDAERTWARGETSRDWEVRARSLQEPAPAPESNPYVPPAQVGEPIRESWTAEAEEDEDEAGGDQPEPTDEGDDLEEAPAPAPAVRRQAPPRRPSTAATSRSAKPAAKAPTTARNRAKSSTGKVPSGSAKSPSTRSKAAATSATRKPASRARKA